MTIGKSIFLFRTLGLSALSLFGANILGGEFDLSSFSGITSIAVDYDALLAVNEAYLGDIRFSVAPTSTIPLPISLPLAASGVGLLGLMRLRRKAARG